MNLLSKKDKLSQKYNIYKAKITRFLQLNEKDQLGWILGIWETDGYLGLTYRSDQGSKSNNPRKYRVDLNLDISQNLKNELICVIICNYFCEIVKLSNPSITTSKDDEKSSKRALKYSWYRTNNIKLFLALLNKAQDYGISFISYKKYDELLIQKILAFMPPNIRKKNELSERSKQYATKILDLKYALHQPNPKKRYDDLSGAQRKIRKDWERDLNLDLNSSIKAAQTELTEITNNYDTHINQLEQNILNKSLLINPYFITGVMEGNGTLSYAIYDSSFKNKNDNRPLKLDIRLKLSGNAFTAILAQVVAYYFGETQPKISIKNNTMNFEIGYTFQRLNIFENVISHFQNYPCFLQEKQDRYELFTNLVKNGYYIPYKQNNILLTKNEITSYINKIYDLDQDRRISREEILERVDNYFN